MPESLVQLLGEGISTSFQTRPSYDSKQDGTISFGPTCSNIYKNFILPGPFASKPDGNFIRNFNYDKGLDEIIFSTLHPFEKGVENLAFMGQSLQKPDCNIFSMSPSYNKGKENVMSLLPCDKAPENRFTITSCCHKENANVLSGGQSTYTEGSEMAFMVSSQDRADQNNNQISHGDRSKTISFGGYQKETTMGFPVRIINSYENFSHAPATADCKTKHPNNHIYFENGKTIYGVVQELKNAPQEKLFEAIQNVTCSDINTWKALYKVASLELQRIYGKDAVTLAS